MAQWTRTFEEAPPITYIRRERFVSSWYRWRNYLRIAIGIGLAVVLGGGGFFFSQRSVATKVSVDDAVGQFRAAAQATNVTTVRTTRDVDGKHGSTAVSRRGPTQAASSVARPAVRDLPKAPEPYALPPEGVYTYQTTGGETISVAGAHHDYPAETTATVRHLGGCRWEFTNNVIKEHTDVLTLCSRRKALYQSEQARSISFYGKTDGQDFTFTPPELVSDTGDAVGATSEATGVDASGSQVRVKRTYLGRDAFAVDGQKIDAVRIHLSSTATGRARGTSVDDVWLDPATAMILRWDRKAAADASSAFGNVHYTEDARFVIKSVKPKT